jgi:D-tyrosyl-tRNA(Tyr) deacylase
VRALLQRVSGGSVTVDGRTVGEISTGLVVLLGIAEGDGEEEARWLVRKMVELRIFEDEEGRMNLSLADVQGEVLLVSQFTLLADTRKGRRPSFTRAAPPDVGEALYRRTADLLREEGIEVATGEFGARMLVEIRNEGPVTILLDSNDRSRSRSA